MSWDVIHGDALTELRKQASDSFDSVCSDPPAGISFMGAAFDTDHGGRDKWIDVMAEIFAEMLRCTKPGGHALIWSLPRTSHWTATALEDAGWQIRERLAHCFGSGFPKSHKFALDYEKALCEQGDDGEWRYRDTGELMRTDAPFRSEDANTWAGWGSATKPALEDWWLCRKPLAASSIAANVLQFGTGGLNIGATRISTGETIRTIQGQSTAQQNGQMYSGKDQRDKREFVNTSGRFPSHLLLSHASPAICPACDGDGCANCQGVGVVGGCVRVGSKRVKGTGAGTGGGFKDGKYSGNAGRGDYTGTSFDGYADADGLETVDAYICADHCPVKRLDLQAGERKSGGSPASVGSGDGKLYPGWGMRSHTSPGFHDAGGVSRFFTIFPPEPPLFYASKSSRAERNRGLENMVVLRPDLTAEQRAWVLAELEKAKDGLSQ